MKKFLSALFLMLTTIQLSLAGSSSYFQLRGTALGTSSTKLQTFVISETQTEVLFSTQNNSKYSDERQKFEFEGDVELKKDVRIKKIIDNKRSSLYKIIITKKNHTFGESSPLFLKISAN
jgi:hypothetical protein